MVLMDKLHKRLKRWTAEARSPASYTVRKFTSKVSAFLLVSIYFIGTGFLLTLGLEFFNGAPFPLGDRIGFTIMFGMTSCILASGVDEFIDRSRSEFERLPPTKPINPPKKR